MDTGRRTSIRRPKKKWNVPYWKVYKLCLQRRYTRGERTGPLEKHETAKKRLAFVEKWYLVPTGDCRVLLRLAWRAPLPLCVPVCCMGLSLSLLRGVYRSILSEVQSVWWVFVLVVVRCLFFGWVWVLVAVQFGVVRYIIRGLSFCFEYRWVYELAGNWCLGESKNAVMLYCSMKMNFNG